jgi:hypothetical protein
VSARLPASRSCCAALPRSPTTAGRHHHEACLPERRAWFSLDPRYLDYDLARRIHHGGRVHDDLVNVPLCMHVPRPIAAAHDGSLRADGRCIVDCKPDGARVITSEDRRYLYLLRSGSSWLALELLELGSDPGEWHDLLA